MNSDQQSVMPFCDSSKEEIDYSYENFFQSFFLFYCSLYFILMLSIPLVFLSKKLYKNLNYTLGNYKTLTIVRGLPGSGKYHYVLSKEHTCRDEFSLITHRDYFIEDGEFKFNGKDLGKSENYMYQQFLESIKNNLDTIYVVGVFEEKWMYANYIKIAKLFDYKVSLLEIDCPDAEHLHYFNSRCKFGTPIKKSVVCYNNWQHDRRSVKIDPYLPKFEGDSLPSVPGLTKKDLDQDLENYFQKEKSAMDQVSAEDKDDENTNSTIDSEILDENSDDEGKDDKSSNDESSDDEDSVEESSDDEDDVEESSDDESIDLNISDYYYNYIEYISPDTEDTILNRKVN